MWPPNKILFPVDFSERSVGAARYVRALCCRFRPEITLIHVLPPPAYGIGSLESGPLMVEEAWEEQQLRAKQDVSEFAARELGSFRVHPMVLEGDPAAAIVEKAQSGVSSSVRSRQRSCMMRIARSGPERIYRLCRLGHHSKRRLSKSFAL